eukprot:TRINITY_DN3881_c0_g1_i2.p1 TRINITY_DN3881_c0_g1~~TRINITY_DN3881_c0_g1_i2.p1  ORF type:complete len:805 (-),score=155.89 TRINITY_DN3881_c0_g1_i2:83-2497(-)
MAANFSNRGSLAVNSWTTNDTQPSQKGILERHSLGFLGTSRWKRKECTLQDGMFSFQKKIGLISLPMDRCRVGEDFGLKKRFCFHIVHERNSVSDTHIFAASSQVEMHHWVDVLTRASQRGSPSQRTTFPSLMIGSRSSSRPPQTPQNASDMEANLREMGVCISPKDINLKEGNDSIIGKGASGIVRKGLWLNSVEVAVKTINNVPEFIDDAEMTSFFKEIELLSKLRHPEIVHFFGYARKDNIILLVTQYIPGGNLETCIHNPLVPMEFPKKLEIALGICRGMVYLHSKGVIHRDLKSANILIESLAEGKVKVCDFGLAKIMSEAMSSMMTMNVYGTPAYQAPELPTKDHTNKVDVFSFAMILWELIERKEMYADDENSISILIKVSQGQRLPLHPSNPFRDLIEICWAHNPNDRPLFSDIYPLLENYREKLQHSGSESAYSSMKASDLMDKSTETTYDKMERLSMSTYENMSSSLDDITIRKQSSKDLSNSPNSQRWRASVDVTRKSPSLGESRKPAYETARTSPTSDKLSRGNSQSDINQKPSPSWNEARVTQPPAKNEPKQSQPPAKNEPKQSQPQPQPKVTLQYDDNSTYSLVSSASSYDSDSPTTIFEGKSRMSWDTFAPALSFQCKSNNFAAAIKDLLYADGFVSKEEFAKFMSWFHPFSLDPLKGYTPDAIAEISSEVWFHGFLTVAQAKTVLMSPIYTDGCFLLRFSSQAGSFALSVRQGYSVCHCRIDASRKGGKTQFTIGTRMYTSLQDLVDKHRVEPLGIKEGNAIKNSVILVRPALRTEVDTQQNEYQNVN